MEPNLSEGHLIVTGEYAEDGNDLTVWAVVIGTEAQARDIAERCEVAGSGPARIEGTVPVYTFPAAPGDRMGDLVARIDESVARHRAALSPRPDPGAAAFESFRRYLRSLEHDSEGILTWQHEGTDPREWAAVSALGAHSYWSINPTPDAQRWALTYTTPGGDWENPNDADTDVGTFPTLVEAKDCAMRHEASGMLPEGSPGAMPIGENTEDKLLAALVCGGPDPDPEHAAHVRDVSTGGE
jgi:hypothetical protein